VLDDLIARNPCRIRGAGLEHAPQRPTASVEDVWNLADAVPVRYRSLVLLAGFCGLRLGELLGLERRHVNLLHGTLTIDQQEQQLRDGRLLVGPPKTEAGMRTLALPPPLIPELEQQLSYWALPGRDGRLFPGERGGPLRRHVWQKYWDRARHAVGLGQSFRFHDLRHTANTLIASSGATTAELMLRMGHASPQAALRYQHATAERDARLAREFGEQIDRRNVPLSEGGYGAG
jgi:integrase